MDDNYPVKYASVNKTNFSIRLCGEIRTAQNGVFECTEEQDVELQKLIATGRPDITQNLRKLDIDAADALARAFVAKNMPQAASGALNTENSALNQMRALNEAQKAEALQNMSPEQKTAMEEAMMTTEPVMPPVNKGFGLFKKAADDAAETPAKEPAA